MEQTYCKVDGIEVNTVTDGFIFYDPSNEMVHFLNHSAMVIWELCTGDNSIGDIAQIVREVYKLDMPFEEIVLGTLADLAAKGLIVQCPE